MVLKHNALCKGSFLPLRREDKTRYARARARACAGIKYDFEMLFERKKEERAHVANDKAQTLICDRHVSALWLVSRSLQNVSGRSRLTLFC